MFQRKVLILISQAREEDYLRVPWIKEQYQSIYNSPFYWDGSFIYGYYQWEEKRENGDDAQD